jgi:hypothetical protein
MASLIVCRYVCISDIGTFFLFWLNETVSIEDNNVTYLWKHFLLFWFFLDIIIVLSSGADPDLDTDPHPPGSALILVDWIRIQGGKNGPTQMGKAKCSEVAFGIFCSFDVPFEGFINSY